MISGLHASFPDRARPGIRFEVLRPPLPEAMPRMDVAAFIGFAQRGPLHWPVAIEDMEQFNKVFGATPLLGWDASGGRMPGHLAESVRAFFTQGGRRCWVVRVASPGARSNQFPIPNLYQVSPGSNGFTVLPVLAQARSEGSWSDRLRVASRLRARPIIVDELTTTGSGNAFEIRTRSDTVRQGDLLRIVHPNGKQQAFFPIRGIKRDNVTGVTVLNAQSGFAFKQGQGDQIDISELSVWLDGRAALLSIDLRVRDEQSSEWRSENLGLTPLHSRYFGSLKTDKDIYQGVLFPNGASRTASSSGSDVDLSPWFPLATNCMSGESSADSFMVPLDMDMNFVQESTAIENVSSELERDGLASLDASMFLDSALRNATIADLMTNADAIRYSAPLTRPLTGIHAVLGWFNTRVQDEVTLIAVPDAVQLPWRGRPQPLRYSYVVEKILPKANANVPLSFTCCAELATPTKLSAETTTPTGTVVRLGWEIPENTNGAKIEYLVQESVTEEFTVTDMQWQTRETFQEITITAPGRRIFRVRAEFGNSTSAWSLPIALRIQETEAAGEPGSPPGEVAREIQSGLIRLCAAQGELFTVLSLPRNITEQDAANHVLTLSATADSVINSGSNSFDPEGRVGSYAAIYHPWVETRSATGSVCPLPPDGAILGMFAARTSARGAWIAPANQALRGVVALNTAVPDVRQVLLTEAGINPVLHRPEGFTLLSEDTLSSAPELQPIHVRRLLILLRRMVLRLGEEFTFETNSPVLRALIRQRCSNMLERMYRAGAFNGRSAVEAFQVSVDDADNPPSSVDVGRLLVRIRVRPAQALHFITVRFTLGGSATGVTEETAP